MIPIRLFSLVFGAPPDASSLAPRVDLLFYSLLAASAVVVAALFIVNLVFLIRYRRGSPAPRPPLTIPSIRIEIGWIAATLVIFLAIFFWGAHLFLFEERPPENATEINVVGRQWMWDIRQPNGRREFDELHVPIDTPVRLLLSSEDVIHSFFVPAFRVKQDVVPGKIVSTWFEATKPGSYRIYCTQYCGTDHARMTGRVIAMQPDAYAGWLAEGNPLPGLERRGRALFIRYGCAGCHTPGSQIHAPRLEGIFGRLQPIENHQFIRADEAYIRDSILLPEQHIVAGYANIMPSFKGVIPEGELLDLVAYVKSLADQSTPPRPEPPTP
ncbi:MAG TPA: cytochrome c oxidase subunit II [Opitutus sp.]|nr:cytochrome c oxidase subunit II [Opitutus sp.]